MRQVDARRQVVLYESRKTAEGTGCVGIRTAVDVDHVESLLSQKGGEHGNGLAHDASEKEEAFVVAFTDKTGAETDVADSEGVESDHLDVVARSQERFGGVSWE